MRSNEELMIAEIQFDDNDQVSMAPCSINDVVDYNSAMKKQEEL